jgi:hypothetical protein
MISLKNVTLVSVSSIKIEETIKSLIESSNGILFNEIILISDEEPNNLPKKINHKRCKKINSIDEYSHFMLFELYKHIKTDFALVVQYDGYVLRPNKWDDEFFNYDYIGAPWPKNAHFNGEKNIRVGNGGFSLRSKNLLRCMVDNNLDFTDNGTGFFNEDGVLCNYHRLFLEKNGIKFAPPDIAAKFSYESNCDETVDEPFGFHKIKK